MAEAPALQHLLKQRSDLWRGRRRPRTPAVASGRAELDAWLPDGGWPSGRLVELLPESLACAELELLLPLLAGQTRRGQPVLLIAPPLVPCPQQLHRAGIALDRLVVIHSSDQALWAAEQSLKSGVCGSVLVWHPRGRVDARSIRRLQLAARDSDAPTFICYRPGQQPPPSLAALRLGLAPGPALRLLRGDGPVRTLHLGRANVIELASRRSAASTS
ncbi:MAG: translesion DNA synthesis-associated protein ImuA [Wenzhouxiangella sp.]